MAGFMGQCCYCLFIPSAQQNNNNNNKKVNTQIRQAGHKPEVNQKKKKISIKDPYLMPAQLTTV